MARRKRGGGGGGPGSGDWLNTYADMVTLLLTFFILLFSMSSLNSAKWNMLVTAWASDSDSSDKIIIRGETQGDKQTGANFTDGEADPQEIDNLDDIFQFIQQLIEENNMQSSLEVAQGEGYVYINFMDNLLFEPNSSQLKPEARSILGFIGDSIKSVQTDANTINIVGHTAAIPGNPDYAVSDRRLSTERANEVLMFFEDTIGIDPNKLFATGYGKWKPLAENDTPEGQSRNRRVEILISSENNSLSQQLDNVYEKLVE